MAEATKKAPAKPAADKAPKVTAPKAAKPASTGAKISVRLLRSSSGQTVSQRATLTGLGFKKSQQTRQVLDTPENRGQIRKVQHLVQIVES